jgi:hypothetical protein
MPTLWKNIMLSIFSPEDGDCVRLYRRSMFLQNDGTYSAPKPKRATTGFYRCDTSLSSWLLLTGC